MASHGKRRGLAVAAVLVLTVGSMASAQTPIPPSAPDFAMAMAQSDQYEIVAGQTALSQSQNPQIRAFAQTMVQDHQRTRERLGEAVTASHTPPPPAAMSTDQAALLSALQSLRGADFDKAYAKQQVLAHSQAVAVERSYAEAGTDPDLRSVAKAGAPLIQHHLDMALAISGALGGG